MATGNAWPIVAMSLLMVQTFGQARAGEAGNEATPLCAKITEYFRRHNVNFPVIRNREIILTNRESKAD